MKKVKIALLMLIAVVFILPSCKKGANDPFLSLSSRKARLTGEWTLKEGQRVETTSTGTTTYTYNGSQVTVTDQYGTSTDTYTEKLTINKDGSFVYEMTQGSYNYKIEGGWYFGGSNKELELKDKEQIVMLTTKETYTYGGNTTIYTYTGSQVNTMVATLDKLSGKEMVMNLDGTSAGSSSTTTTGTMTYEQ